MSLTLRQRQTKKEDGEERTKKKKYRKEKNQQWSLLELTLALPVAFRGYTS